jgi:SsrA-binding protein
MAAANEAGETIGFLHYQTQTDGRNSLSRVASYHWEYAPAGALGHKPKRARALLAHKREILKIATQLEKKGMTVVPLKLYFKDGWAKMLIGVARGKDKADKRQTISAREAKRDIDRAMSKRR